MAREDRMNTLANNGIDTSKYFTVAIDKNLPKGTTFTVTIGEDGIPTLTSTEIKAMVEKIENEGYVNNPHLFRRWVMAQTFHMEKENGGYTAALKRKPYSYQWKVLKNELAAMSKIEKEDPVAFMVRKDFFAKWVICETLKDYRNKLLEYYGEYSWRAMWNNRAVEITNAIILELIHASSYQEYNKLFNDWLNRVWKDRYFRLPETTEKCAAWVDAYKGAGAYYTMENMIKFHDCRFHEKYRKVSYKTTLSNSLEMLEAKRVESKDAWWKLFGTFRELVKDNNFDFGQRMTEVYASKR